MKLFETHFDEIGVADCLDGLGIIAFEQMDYKSAEGFLTRSLAAYPDSAGSQLEAWVHNDLAQLRLLQRNFPSARRHAKQALKVGRSQVDRGLMTWAYNIVEQLMPLDLP